ETLTFSNVSRLAPIGLPALFVDGQFVTTGAVTRLESAVVSMLTTFPNGTILFSTDGSLPSFLSTAYNGPFTLNRSHTIRAVAYDSVFSRSWEADPVEVVIVPTYAVHTSTAGGGTVALAPVGVPYLRNDVVTLTAVPASGWSFLQWLGDAMGTNAVNTLAITRDKCVESVFGTGLSNAAAGSGTLMISPTASRYPFGAVVRLTAVPQTGSSFALWGGAASGTNNPLFFTVTNANPIVSAAFAPLSAGQFALTIIAEGNGRVTANPRGNRFNSGQSVTLTAFPDAGQLFLGWSGDASGVQNPLTVVMDQSRVITAGFSKRPRLALLSCFGALDEGALQLTITGNLGEQYQVEASEDLQPPWTTLATVRNAFGTVQFNHPFATNRMHRFYRATRAE
ncbi:MAG TPA: chitobiase/beta-hexosaminidase C-terminal domain-containing protein, partial [Verrucomicrobiae bacterium]